jgi:hypothetical protein
MINEIQIVGILRNGVAVRVFSLADEDAVAPWKWIGSIDERGTDIWTQNGKWSEEDGEHPLDIVRFKEARP